MKKALAISALIMLAACDIENSEDNYVLTGDVSAVDNGSDSLSGSIALPQGINFHQQIDTNLEYGSFNIKANGEWSYYINRADEDLLPLTSADEVIESITITTTDTRSHILPITIKGTDDVPTFGQGVGIDQAELLTDDVNQTVAGKLTVVDPDEGQSSLLAINTMQGKSGHFSISESGEWQYTFTNLNGESKEVFTVSSVDGSQYQVVIDLKAKYQRIAARYTFSASFIPFDYFLDSDNLLELVSDAQISHYQYNYNDNGTLANITDLTDVANPIVDREFSYQYQDNQLTKIIVERGFWSSSDTTLAGSQRTYQYDWNAELGRSPGHESKTDIYDDAGVVEDTIISRYSKLYNQYGKRSHFYLSNDSVTDALIADYSYTDAGDINFRQNYSTSTGEKTWGYDYYYDQYGRISHNIRTDSVDPTFVSKRYQIYAYYPDISAIVRINLSEHTPEYDAYQYGYLDVYSVTIKFYEDAYSCGAFIDFYYEPDVQCMLKTDLPNTQFFPSLDF